MSDRNLGRTTVLLPSASTSLMLSCTYASVKLSGRQSGGAKLLGWNGAMTMSVQEKDSFLYCNDLLWSQLICYASK